MRQAKMTTAFQQALAEAQSLAIARDNPYIEPAHLLAAMLEQPDGPKALLDPDAALHVPFRVDPGLWAFLASFASRGTNRAWDRTMASLTPIDRLALECFDELNTGGVDAWTREGPFVIGFAEEAHSRGFLHEIEGVIRHGQDVPFERLENPRELAPQLSEAVKVAYRLDGQRFLEPGPSINAIGPPTNVRTHDKGTRTARDLTR